MTCPTPLYHGVSMEINSMLYSTVCMPLTHFHSWLYKVKTGLILSTLQSFTGGMYHQKIIYIKWYQFLYTSDHK